LFTRSIVATFVTRFGIISSVLIACGVTAVMIVHVFVFIVGSAIHGVVIVGTHAFIAVLIIKQRFRVRFLSHRILLSGLCVGGGRMRRLNSGRDSENAE
jgi:hypothetical protein